MIGNYCSITCIPLMWKLYIGVIAEEIYDYLEREKLLPEEQKWCRWKNCGTKDQLLIDKIVLKDFKIRHTNLSMTWIDYKKTCDFTPHSWFNKCIELFGIADNVKNFLEKSMEEWKLLLMSNGEDFGKFDVKRGIFQGHSSSPLLFVLSTILLSLILKKVNASYEWRKEKYKLNHF